MNPGIVAADLIPGTTWDDWLLAVVGILVAVTTVTALSHKPPIVQIGHFIGWVFRRLIGEPVATWWAGVYESHALPLVRHEIDAALGPIRTEQERVGVDLRAHMVAEAQERAELMDLITSHVKEDRAAFAEIAEWRGDVDVALGNIQAGQAPHTDR